VEEGVREATSDDVPRLVELARAAIRELTPMKGGSVWAAREARVEPLDPDLLAALGDAGRRAVVGTIDDAVVGYGMARVELLRDGSRLGVVDDIFVEEDARGIGVGELMMGELVSWCRDQGCFGIDVMALPGHRAAKNFFEESGFTARQIVMHHRLGGP
jgi:GNAT superfamily N-acetyltransferase